MLTLGSVIGKQLIEEAIVYPDVLQGINELEAAHPRLLANRQRILLSDPEAELAMTIFEQAMSLLLAPIVEHAPMEVYTALHTLGPVPGFRTMMVSCATASVAATAFLLEFMTVENNYFDSIAAHEADEMLQLEGVPFIQSEWVYEQDRLDALRAKWYNRPQ